MSADGPYVQLSPTSAIGFSTVTIDRDAQRELGISADYRVTLHLRPTDIFQNYLECMQIKFDEPISDIQYYAWVSDRNLSLEICISAGAELMESVKECLKFFGANIQASIFAMLPVRSQPRNGDRIFSAALSPDVTFTFKDYKR